MDCQLLITLLVVAVAAVWLLFRGWRAYRRFVGMQQNKCEQCDDMDCSLRELKSYAKRGKRCEK